MENTQTLKQTAPVQLSSEVISQWFDKYISHISVDKMMMETATANAETAQFYNDLISENHDATNSFLRNQSTIHFISRILGTYLVELAQNRATPNKIAFDYSDAKILVWAEIKSDDESTEDALLLAEAKTNCKFSDNGFYISSTIVEDTDHLKIPSHYHELKFNGRFSSAHKASQ